MPALPDAELRTSRYTFTEELHRGGHVALYRGHRREDGAGVLARVLLGGRPSPRDLARLRYEHAVLKELDVGDVPQVVRAISLEEHGHGLLLVLEDPGGGTLRALMDAGRIEVGEALRIAASLAGALESLHRRNILHKDIRPENILVEPETYRVCLLGFGGASRLAQESPLLTSPDALEGALTHVAPEQTGRVNRPLDRRTDLYSLGVTLYEMLTSALPFTATDAMELVHSHLARTPSRPHERAPWVPEVISSIVMKLLAKAPEDRYQHAAGLEADLRECLSSWEAGQGVPTFPLDRRDPRGELRIPQRLYGRDPELAALSGAFARTREGRSAELLLISGYSGIGKSVLVHELLQDIASARGYFASGKFDQLNRGVPYSSVAQAFQELVHQVLAEREESLAALRERILGAVAANGRVLTDLIPSLSLLIGPLPEVPELPPAAAQARLGVTFQNFVQVFATAERPLVVFLDDLQWADAASLELLKLLVTAQEGGALLVIGAYRSNEVDAGHPLLKVLREIQGSARITSIELRPLGRADVGQFVADTLGEEPLRVEPLAKVVFEKTQGNPFFLIQFLSALHKDALLDVDPASGRFRWDLDAIRTRMATDNVIEFMAERIRRLSPRTVNALRLSACIGHRFDVWTLATVRDAPPAEVAAELWEALEAGVIVPLGAEYRFFHGASGELPPDLDASYRFLHDRVQQAAYSLIDEEQRAAIHLRIGRALLAGAGGAPGEDLFEIVAHLNVGADLIAEPEERLRLARLNLEAGRKAKASAAYAAAAGFLAKGASLLGQAGWDDELQLSFELHLQRAECEAMAGAFEEAASLHRVLLEHAQSDLERTQVYTLRVVLCAAQGRSSDALDVGLAALGVLGIEVYETEEEWKAAFEAELDEITRRLAGRDIEELVSAPLMTDPGQKAILRLFQSLTGSAYGFRPSLSDWIITRPVNLCLEHGNSSEAAVAYALHGANLANRFSRPAEGYAFARLGLALHEKIGRAEDAAPLYYFAGNACNHAAHWRKAIGYFERCVAAGLASGDFVSLCYASNHTVIARIALGDPLPALRDEAARLVALTERNRVASSNAMLTVSRQMIDNLLGRTHDLGTLSGDQFDEAQFVLALEGKGFKVPVAWYCTAKGELAFLYGDHEGAVAMLSRARELGSINFTEELTYYLCLAIVARSEEVPEEEDRARLAVLLARCVDELDRAALGCAENYQHKLLLVRAELARTSQDHERAMDLYEQAIDMAERNGWVRDVALGSELCARLALKRGRARSARAFMEDACYAYARWGAVAKVRRLAERYPELVPVEVQEPAYPALPAEGLALDRIDGTAFVRMLQALASELVLDNVIDRLMRLVLQNSGAQRGFLLLEHEGALFIEAEGSVDPDRVTVGLGAPLDDRAELAVSVVRYVERLKEPVVLGDAAREGLFAADPYIAARRPRSLACLAMTHQGRSKGVLYLEHNALGGAFTKDRVELLGLLLSQAAISIENARLYARVQAMTEELLRSKEALLQSNGELRVANDRLAEELSSRERSEELRFELQAEILRVQREKLVELSTPIIPIARGILVMPLVGSIDMERARRVLEVALSGVHTRRARVLIFDITGVKDVDGEVAGMLVRTAMAISMLGAETVITGVGPEVAHRMVQLGIEFGAVVTRASLESGIAYALKQTGYRLARDRAARRSAR